MLMLIRFDYHTLATDVFSLPRHSYASRYRRRHAPRFDLRLPLIYALYHAIRFSRLTLMLIICCFTYATPGGALLRTCCHASLLCHKLFATLPLHYITNIVRPSI